MLNKFLSELQPYASKEIYILLFFLVMGIVVILLHCLFTKYRIIKYIPGISLVLLSFLILIFQRNDSIFQTSPKTIHLCIALAGLGMFSIFFALIIAVMYKSNKSIKKKVKMNNEEAKID